MNDDPVSPGAPEEFMRHFAIAEQEIRRYIRACLPDEDEAKEVFQNTCLIIWQKYKSMPSTEDFTAWACRVAHFQLLSFRRQHARDKLRFSDDVLEKVLGDRLTTGDNRDARRRALAQCLEKLVASDRKLVELRFSGNLNSRQTAEKLGRPVNTVYKALERIRRQLFECVTRTLRSEEHLQ